MDFEDLIDKLGSLLTDAFDSEQISSVIESAIQSVSEICQMHHNTDDLGISSMFDVDGHADNDSLWDNAFLGNGDKHIDNDYNRKQFDKWMEIYAEKLKKGDKTGAEAALATANDHLRRIKK